jgi:hypothetical protein
MNEKSEVAFLRERIVGLESKLCEVLANQQSVTALTLQTNLLLIQFLNRQLDHAGPKTAPFDIGSVLATLTSAIGGALQKPGAEEIIGWIRDQTKPQQPPKSGKKKPAKRKANPSGKERKS